MPRIPVRVEPYSSPSKQHRHYKCKRDQVLRALGKAAYINGSQFAIMWVSARGDVETYASDAFQGRLDDWFEGTGIADEARRLACAHRAPQLPPPPPPEDEPEADTSADLSISTDDPFLDTWSSIGQNAQLASEDIHTPVTVPSASTPVQPSTHATPATGAPPAHSIVLRDEHARTEFYQLRFSQLQQVMCKMVAKAWIKVIEPKKQTRCPYNKGEDGRPAWWPAEVRHKEPDHLMKPERHALLLSLLRCGVVRIARLQLATAEVVALIKAGKVSLLMDVYRLAREEERLRDEGTDSNTPVTISVSTTKGWDVANSCLLASSDPEVHGSPDTFSDTPDMQIRRAPKRRALSTHDENTQSPVPMWPKSEEECTPLAPFTVPLSPQPPLRSHTIHEPAHDMSNVLLTHQQRMALLYGNMHMRRSVSVAGAPPARQSVPPEWDMPRAPLLDTSAATASPEPHSAPLDGHLWSFAPTPGLAPQPPQPRLAVPGQMYMPNMPVTTPEASFTSFDSSLGHPSTPLTPSFPLPLQCDLGSSSQFVQQPKFRPPMILSDTTNLMAHKPTGQLPPGSMPLDTLRWHPQ